MPWNQQKTIYHKQEGYPFYLNWQVILEKSLAESFQISEKIFVIEQNFKNEVYEYLSSPWKWTKVNRDCSVAEQISRTGL